MKTENLRLSTPFDIPVLMYLPDDEANKVVIAVHGLLGSKSSRVTKAVAERLTTQHTVVIAFDLPCHGESQTTERDLTVENCMDALIAVADFAEKRFPHVYDFGIFATSFGAYITLNAADRLQEQLGDYNMVLRAPAVKMADTLLRVLKVTEAELESKGQVDCGSYADRVIKISYDFYKDLKAHDVYYDNDRAFMIIHGDKDTFVTHDEIMGYIALNADVVYAPVKNATHTFGNPGDVEKIVGYADMWFAYRAQDFD